MKIDRNQLHFTDPTSAFEGQGLDLVEALRRLIMRAKTDIFILSYNINRQMDFVLNEELLAVLRDGVRLTIIGNDRTQVESLTHAYSPFGAKGFYWNPNNLATFFLYFYDYRPFFKLEKSL